MSIQIVYATTDINVSDSDYYNKVATACLNFENDIKLNTEFKELEDGTVKVVISNAKEEDKNIVQVVPEQEASRMWTYMWNEGAKIA